MRVVVTRIDVDGTMQRRVVDTAQRDDGRGWEDLAARALASPPPYRPIPGTAVYHVSVDNHQVQAGEYDLDGPLQDLVTVVLAMGDEVLSPPDRHGVAHLETPWLDGGAIDTRVGAAVLPDDLEHGPVRLTRAGVDVDDDAP